jgi:hypothetical protein
MRAVPPPPTQPAMARVASLGSALSSASISGNGSGPGHRRMLSREAKG